VEGDQGLFGPQDAIVPRAGRPFVSLLQERQGKGRRVVFDYLWAEVAGTIVDDDNVVGQTGLMVQCSLV
jgi:hypothetical protein